MISHFDKASTVHVVQITDCHIHSDTDTLLSGVNTFDSLTRVIEGVNASPEPMDMVLVTGDLVHEADERAYRLLLRQLEKLRAPYFWLPGNHDYQQLMLTVGSDERLRTKQIVLPHWQILLVDSHEDDEVNGLVSQSELTWLATALREYPEKYAAIFVHHHVVPIGSAWLDSQRIANAEQLLALYDNTPQLRLVCNGHVHQEWELEREHYWLMTTPSTSIQFKINSDDYAEDDYPPGYRRFAFHADGRFDTTVVRVGELVRVEGAPRGYSDY